jgi:F0F1-type ATP synthase delta subunit
VTQVLPATLRLAAYAVSGGRARDIVATLDALVEDAARARGWRVARVHAATEVDETQQRELSEALTGSWPATRSISR